MCTMQWWQLLRKQELCIIKCCWNYLHLTLTRLHDFIVNKCYSLLGLKFRLALIMFFVQAIWYYWVLVIHWGFDTNTASFIAIQLIYCNLEHSTLLVYAPKTNSAGALVTGIPIKAHPTTPRTYKESLVFRSLVLWLKRKVSLSKPINM